MLKLISGIFISLIFAGMLPVISQGADPIKIGLVVPLTGPLSHFGNSLKKAAKAAAEDINANGGVLGRNVELIIKDDSCDPTNAVTAAMHLAKEKVSFVVGHACSGASIAASEVYRRENIIQMTPSASAPEFTEREFENVFRLNVRSDRMGEFIGEYLGRVDNLDKYSIALISEDTPYGIQMTQSIKEVASNNKANIVFTELYPRQLADFQPAVSKMKKYGVQIVCVVSSSALDQLNILRAIRNNGLNSLAVINDTINSHIFSQKYDYPQESGPVMLSGLPDYSKLEKVKYLVKRLGLNELDAINFSLFTYAAVEIFAETAKRAEDFTYQNFIKQLKPNKNFETIIGHLSFDEKGDVIDTSPIFYKLKKGKFLALNTRPPPPPPPP